MAFIGRQDVLDVESAVAQSDHDLLGLAAVDARIVGALSHQQRSLDLVGGVERRLLHQQFLAVRRTRIGHAQREHFARRFPVGRNRFEQRNQVRWSDNVHRGGVKIRREGDPGQRGIAAIRAAQNTHALGVGDSLCDQVLHAPREVVLHLAAPLDIAGVEELLPIARRSAEVGLEHRIAAIGEELRQRVVSPFVAPPRAAVRKNDGGQVLRAELPWAASGKPGSPARRKNCSEIGFISARSSRGSFSRILYCGVSVWALRSNRNVSPGSVSLSTVTSQRLSSRVRDTTRISLPGNCFSIQWLSSPKALSLKYTLTRSRHTRSQSVHRSFQKTARRPGRPSRGSDSTSSVFPLCGSNSTEGGSDRVPLLVSM